MSLLDHYLVRHVLPLGTQKGKLFLIVNEATRPFSTLLKDKKGRKGVYSLIKNSNQNEGGIQLKAGFKCNSKILYILAVNFGEQVEPLRVH